MQITVYTIDGEHEKTVNLHLSIDEWESFEAFVATYIDTEGSAGRTGDGYVVQLIDDDGNVVAEETQESY